MAVLVERRYLTHEQPTGMWTALRRRGHEVRVIGAEEAFEAGDGGWFEAADVVVARGRSSELLSLLHAAEHRGLPTVNHAAGIAAVQNKARLAARLEAGGIPTVVAAAGVAPSVRRFARVDAPRLTLLAAGRRVWTAHHGSPGFVELESELAGDPFVTPGLLELAIRCGRLLGLRLYGVECVPSPNGARVADVLDFPGYEGVPDASAALAQQVMASVEDRRQ